MKVGDTVRLVDDEGLAALKGSRAVITSMAKMPAYIDVRWMSYPAAIIQSDGGYAPRRFVPYAPIKDTTAVSNSKADFRIVGTKAQVQYLVEHFAEKPSITAVEAAALYRIRSLSRRICDLREIGYEIAKQHSKDPTGQRYVRYHMVRAPGAR